jgi:hypothetical protein
MRGDDAWSAVAELAASPRSVITPRQADADHVYDERVRTALDDLLRTRRARVAS